MDYSSGDSSDDNSIEDNSIFPQNKRVKMLSPGFFGTNYVEEDLLTGK
jgi:hypothetical protein